MVRILVAGVTMQRPKGQHKTGVYPVEPEHIWLGGGTTGHWPVVLRDRLRAEHSGQIGTERAFPGGRAERC